MRATACRCVSIGTIVLGIFLSAKTASAQYKKNINLEAECPSSSTGAYGTKLTSTAGYSIPGYIKSQGNTTAATYNNSSVDHAVYNFTANTSGFLTVYFRVNTNGNAANDSFFYRVNGSSWETVDNLSSLGTGWRWAQGASLFGVQPVRTPSRSPTGRPGSRLTDRAPEHQRSGRRPEPADRAHCADVFRG